MSRREQTQNLIASKELRTAAAAVVHSVGEVRAAEELQLSRPTLLRLLAGLPVRRGTLALARERLGVPAR